MQQENQQQYYMVVDEKSTGPYSFDEVISHPKLTPDTLVWKPGIDNWVAAKTLPELEVAFIKKTPDIDPQPPFYSGFADNPQYRDTHRYEHEHHQQHHNYYGQNHYNNGYRPNYRTNWLPWAIVATVFGFFASCIGAIFGIIGIVQANKANTCYARGLDREGDAANSNAKIMTIIGLIFAGIGILVAFWFGSFFTSLSNLSYL